MIKNCINTLELVFQVWGGCRRDYDSAGSVVFLYYLKALVWFTLKQLRHKCDLYSKQHLILYFPELNNRMNLSNRNMFQIFYFLLSTNTKACIPSYLMIFVWVIARVAVLFGIDSTSNAIEIAWGEAECYLLANSRPAFKKNHLQL